MSDLQRYILFWVLLVLAVPAFFILGELGGTSGETRLLLGLFGSAAVIGAAFYVRAGPRGN